MPAVILSEFPIRTLGGNPIDVASDPAGFEWFTLPNNIGRLELSTGNVTQYPLPTYNAGPTAITVGSDGNIWFLETAVNSIARLDRSSGLVTEFPVLSSTNSGLTGITSGPDGNLWFTETTANRIGRLIPGSGVIREFDAPQGAQPWGITSGTDGSLWYAMFGTNQIGRFNTSTLTTTAVTVAVGSNLGLKGIACGTDGRLWYTASVSNQVGTSSVGTPSQSTFYSNGLTANAGLNRITATTIAGASVPYFTETALAKVGTIPAGATKVTEIAVTQSAPNGLAVGLDNFLYIAGTAANKLGKLNVGGTTATSLAYASTAGINPGGMIWGSDGALWYTLPSANSIGRFDPVTHFAEEIPLTLKAGSNLGFSLVAGPGGDFLFPETGPYIGRFNPATRKLTTEYKSSSANPQIFGITYNTVDGGIWYTAPGTNKVGRFDLGTGASVEWSVPTTNGQPLDITFTPKPGSAYDGFVWFTEGAGKIAKIDIRANPPTITEKVVGGAPPSIVYNTVDGNLWFASGGGVSLGKLDPSTSNVTTIPIPAHGAYGNFNYTTQISLGSDGRVWGRQQFNWLDNTIPFVSVDPTSLKVTELFAPKSQTAILAAPDGNLWYTMGGAPGSIGELLASVSSLPTSLTISTQPPASNSTARGFGLVVTATNAAGRPAIDYNGPITISLGTNPTGATLGGTLTVNAVNGKATFKGLTINKTGAGYVVRATSTDLPGMTVNSTPFDFADPATHLAISTVSSTLPAGGLFSIVVRAVDNAGRTDPSFFGGINLVLQGGGNGPSPILKGVRSMAADLGVASFNGLSIDQAGSAYSILASGSLIPAVTSSNFDVVPAAASGFEISTSPNTLVAGIPFELTVKSVDAFGNLVPTFTGTVSFASGDSRAKLPDAYTFVASDLGVHRFSLTLVTAGTVDVRALSDTSAGSRSFHVLPAAVASIAMRTASANVWAGVPFDVVVSALDEFGNVNPGYLGNVRYTSSDTTGAVPPDYRFTAADAGTKTFQVKLSSLGNQFVAVTDTENTSRHDSFSVAVALGLTRTTIRTITPGLVYGQVWKLAADVSALVPGGKDIGGTVQFLVDGLSNGPAVPIINGTASRDVTGIHAGTHTISAVYSGDAAYDVSSSAISAVVDKAPLSIRQENLSRVYGSPNPAFTVKYVGFAWGDGPANLAGTLIQTTNADSSSHVGNYYIKPSGVTSDDYTLSFGSGTLQVTKAPLQIVVDNQTRPYGSQPTSPTFHYEGFVNGDSPASLSATPVVLVDAGLRSSAGKYPLKGSRAAASDYVVTYSDATLTITPVALKVTVDNSTATYGSPLPAFSARIEGFVLSEGPSSLANQPAFQTEAKQGTAVGNYPVTASGASSQNYTFTYLPGTLAIGKAPLKIIADDQRKVVGAPLPSFSLRYSGFVNGDSASSLTKQPVVASQASQSSSVGNYPITVGGATSNNYDITFQPGTLKIVAPVVPISVVNTTRKGLITGVTLTFDGALDVSIASKPSTYVQLLPGKDGKYGTKDDRRIPIASVSVGANRRTVTLAFASPLAAGALSRVIAAGLVDASGILIDGDGDHVPDGGVIVSLTKKGSLFGAK